MSDKRLYHFIAYVAMFITAVSIMLGYFFKENAGLAQICDFIAFFSMLIVTGLGAFYYARSKRRLVWMLLFIAVMATIVIFKIIPLF